MGTLARRFLSGRNTAKDYFSRTTLARDTLAPTRARVPKLRYSAIPLALKTTDCVTLIVLVYRGELSLVSF